MKTGDQIIYKADNIIGKLIGFFTKSNYSHTGTVIRICEINFVLEAKASGVRLISFWDSVEGKDYMILELNGKLDEDKLLSDLQEIVSRSYDYENFFKHAFKKKSIWRKIFNIKEKNDKHICSGLSVWILENYGNFEELENINSTGFVPGDFITHPILKELFYG